MRVCETKAGWDFVKNKKYFRGKCGCGTHMKTVHLTPNGAYLENLKHYFMRLECWNREVTL